MRKLWRRFVVWFARVFLELDPPRGYLERKESK